MSAAASRHLPPPSSLCSSLSSLPYPSRANVGSARLLPPMVPSFLRLRVRVQQSKMRDRAVLSGCAVGVVMGAGLRGKQGGVRSGWSRASSVSSGCGGLFASGRWRGACQYHETRCCRRRVSLVTGGGIDSVYSALPCVQQDGWHVMRRAF
jgi:hypothetical protein